MEKRFTLISRLITVVFFIHLFFLKPMLSDLTNTIIMYAYIGFLLISSYIYRNIIKNNKETIE